MLIATSSPWLWILAGAGWVFIASLAILMLSILLKYASKLFLARSIPRFAYLWISVGIYAFPMVIADVVGHRNIDPFWPEIAVHYAPLLVAPSLALVARVLNWVIEPK